MAFLCRRSRCAMQRAARAKYALSPTRPCRRSWTPCRRPSPPSARWPWAFATAPTLKKSSMSTRKTIPILPSRVTVEGLDRAPHRAFLHALGLSDADLKKPFVGVASTDGRVTPCNALLGEFAREACAAVREAGGVPFDFASISGGDSMLKKYAGKRYSPVSRGGIARRGEAGTPGPAYDPPVTLPRLAKT